MEALQYFVWGLIVWLVISKVLPVKGLTNLSSTEVEEMLKTPGEHEFVDVREIFEYQQGHIKGFKNIPLSQLARRLDEIDPKKSVVLTCRSGMRSRKAAKILKKNGYNRISHLKTGVSG